MRTLRFHDSAAIQIAGWAIATSAWVLGAASGIAQESLLTSPLPSATDPPVDIQSTVASKSHCPNLVDAPLATLSVDIDPRDANGAFVPQSETPANCWQAKGTPSPPLFVGGEPARCTWGCHELLQLARFCHQRVYFEDAPLERCGVTGCCPQLQSTAKFTRDLIVLPWNLLQHKHNSCVSAPTPHCCSPYGCNQSDCRTCGR